MSTYSAKQTVERIYAGWLGKLIGVRLGAPVEMWSSEQILEKYGEQAGYLKDYHEFAADDDTNGPTFFIRAMEDSGRYRDLTCADVGRAWLNYPPWGKGMYWWGGYGVSAEHTAYENLRAGVEAPRSGSAALNGEELSGQIGGQIFSDAWGLVCPGDPALAADLSEKAARVSHDGEAVYGGRFVAACIAAAFTRVRVEDAVEDGLAQIPADSAYARVFRAVRTFHAQHPGKWRDCLEMLRAEFWRDRFGGNCHVIPNAGIMALALYYGQGSFDDTLRICNCCGFDTDCNVGNVGSILGVLVGLEGIDAAWRAPINDFYACSSVLGALNLCDAASFALELARLAGKLGVLRLPEELDALPRLNFRLPGSTHGCLIRQGEEEACAAFGRWSEAHGGSLRVPLTAGRAQVWQRTYMRPEEFSDDRYTPSFSPALYPGQAVTASVCGASGARARLFVYDGNAGEFAYGEWSALLQDGPAALRFTVPAMTGACLMRVGVEWDAAACGEGCEGALLSLDWDGEADYAMDFAKERHERWSFAHQPVSQCAALKGHWILDHRMLRGSCGDLGEAYTGDPSWRDYAFTCTLIPQSGGNHRLLARVQGGARAYAAELSESGLSLLKNDAGWTALAGAPLKWSPGAPVTVCIRVNGARIRVEAGEARIDYTDEENPLLHGCVGFGVACGSACAYEAATVRPLREEA